MMRCYHIAIKMTEIYWMLVEQLELPYVAVKNAKLGSHLGKQFSVSHKAKHTLIL